MLGIPTTKNNCDPCSKKRISIHGKKYIGLLTGILLALLPKCPFCFVAFSSTLILCGNAGGMATRTFSSPATLGFSIGFCLLTLISIILNYRDARTKYAIFLVVSGSCMVILSVTTGGGYAMYYGGILVIFTGVWLNASLLFFIQKIKTYLK